MILQSAWSTRETLKEAGKLENTVMIRMATVCVDESGVHVLMTGMESSWHEHAPMSHVMRVDQGMEVQAINQEVKRVIPLSMLSAMASPPTQYAGSTLGVQDYVLVLAGSENRTMIGSRSLAGHATSGPRITATRRCRGGPASTARHKWRDAPRVPT